MSFELIEKNLAPAEGEVTVRTYHCTTLSPVFSAIGMKTNGHMTVTNKRLVYFASGSSLFGAEGKSAIYSEVPITDVTSLSFAKGTRFSFLRFIIGLVVGLIAFVATGLLANILALKSAQLSGLDGPYLSRLVVLTSFIVSTAIILLSWRIPRDSIRRVALSACAIAAPVSLAVTPSAMQRIIFELPTVYARIGVLLAVALAAYLLWCLYWFIRRQYLAVTVYSKGSQNTPISIVGVSWWGRINVMAGLASRMAPAVDADAMFRELGAIVADIKALGDNGIAKWRVASPVVDSTHESRANAARFLLLSRCAAGLVIMLTAFVGVESWLYAAHIKSTAATRLRADVAAAKSKAKNESSAHTLAPVLWSLAEEEESRGREAFEMGNLDDAMAIWRSARDKYVAIVPVAADIKRASTMEGRHLSIMSAKVLDEVLRFRLKPVSVMTDFVRVMDGSTNDLWLVVKGSVEKAALFEDSGKWEQAGMAWDLAGARLPGAMRQMRANEWVGKAEMAMRNDNTESAWTYAESALQEVPLLKTAAEIKNLISNRNQFNRALAAEIEEGNVMAVDLPSLNERLKHHGGAEWQKILEHIEGAKVAASEGNWGQSGEEWRAALNTLPGVIAAMRMDRAESEARRGNWDRVGQIAETVLSRQPDHKRAQELSKKAGLAESVLAAENRYYGVLSDAMHREVRDGRVKAGGVAEFEEIMDEYGMEEWKAVKQAVNDAKERLAEEQGSESLAAWSKAGSLLLPAVKRMRCEVLLSRAEAEARTNNWSAVLILAEKALKEKPGSTRAEELRDRADSEEEMRSMKDRFERALNRAAVELVDVGIKSGDRGELDRVMKKFGGETWNKAQKSSARAADLATKGRLAESAVAWLEAEEQVAASIGPTRIAYWLNEAENDALAGLWARSRVSALKVLKADPSNQRAKALLVDAESHATPKPVVQPVSTNMTMEAIKTASPDPMELLWKGFNTLRPDEFNAVLSLDRSSPKRKLLKAKALKALTEGEREILRNYEAEMKLEL